jgi:histidine triad (HIT) family protein
MEDCIFCQIVEGKIPAAKVYEDDNILAFMTIQAINPGHILVIPKKHFNEFYELDSENYSRLMDTVQQVARSVKKVYKPKRVGLLVQGFEIAHAHIHVVPLHESTDVTSKKLLEGTALHPSPDELNAEAEKIKNNL